MKNIIDVNYNVLPADVVEATKKQTLDTLGVAIGGSGTEGIGQLVGLVKEWGGREESTIIVHGGRVPNHHAALVNATMTRALDYDDTHELARLHPSGVIVPACFAVAEHKGAISGKDFIVAVALGTDLMCRLSRAPYLGFAESGWDFSDICGFFGAAAAASKVIGLNEEKLTNALSIAYQQAAGNINGIEEGASVKALGSGFAAKGGIVAALMAERGLTGSKDCLEHKHGFYNTYHRGLYNPGLLTIGLGKIFEGKNTSLKPYPCCRLSHTFVDATLALMDEDDINPGDVAEVIPYVSATAQLLCEPLEEKQSPSNPTASQFSIPWVIAGAIVRRKVGLGEFTEEAIRDTKMIEMAHRVTPELDVELSASGTLEAAIVKIRTKSGETYSKHVGVAFGNVQKPMTFRDVVEKFNACCSYAAKPIPQENIDKVVRMVEKLENVTNACEIIRLLGNVESV